MILLRNARVPTLALQIDALADPGTLHLSSRSMSATGCGSRS